MARVKTELFAIALAIVLSAANVRAEGDPLGTEEVAEAIVRMTTPVWTGPRTLVPTPTPRPRNASITIRSNTALLAVHGPPSADPTRLTRVMEALEYARAALDIMGWPSPLPDGDLGGGPDLDLYLAPSNLPTSAHSDGIARWTFLDRASAFAVVNPDTPDRSIEACVTTAYAEALLLSMDPAESHTWRRATAAWLTWVLTGRFGCDDAVWEQQAEPFRSWIRNGAEGGAGGALLLAFLSSRHDRGRPEFVRDAWELSSQRTWEGEGLRAEPDLWAAIETSVERSGDRLIGNIEELAVLRWFVGRGDSEGTFISSIDDDAQVPVMRRLKRLPTRASGRIPLQAFGSAYVLLARSSWGTSNRLRAWLRAEYGVRWSFIAVQLDEGGNEIQRVVAPPTGLSSEAYLPIELVPDARTLLMVVTNLSSRLPDADEPDANERSFEVILDRVAD